MKYLKFSFWSLMFVGFFFSVYRGSGFLVAFSITSLALFAYIMSGWALNVSLILKDMNSKLDENLMGEDFEVKGNCKCDKPCIIK